MIGVDQSWTVTHDFLYVAGGAEVTTRALSLGVFGGAPVRYLAGDPAVVRSLDLPPTSKPILGHRHLSKPVAHALSPLYPAALYRAAPIDGNVIASSYAFSHHVRCTGRKIVYCHSPFRHIWSGYQDYVSGLSRRSERLALRAVGAHLRERDVRASRSAEQYIATGPTVADRIREYYGISKIEIVAPPVDSNLFRHRPHTQRAGFYLWAGRIVEPYKRLSMVVGAFRELRDLQLIVVGDGEDRERLEATAPPNVLFMGWRPAEQVAQLYSTAQAVIFPSVDDFGLVPVEAMSCGTSVIAIDDGGSAKTVIPGFTGLLFHEPTSAAVAHAVREHARHAWDSAAIAEYAAQFGIDRFCSAIQEIIFGAPFVRAAESSAVS